MLQMTDTPISNRYPCGFCQSIMGDWCDKIKTVQLFGRAYSSCLTLIKTAQPAPETPPASPTMKW